jgi:hypothetical protein
MKKGMLNRIIIFLFIIVPPTTAFGKISANTYEGEVSAMSCCNPTGIIVSSGDRIQILATGTWCFGSPPVYCNGPAGSSYTEPTGSGWHYLMARINTGGAEIEIDSSQTFVAYASGELYMGMYDCCYGDNFGSLNVTVTLNPPIQHPNSTNSTTTQHSNSTTTTQPTTQQSNSTTLTHQPTQQSNSTTPTHQPTQPNSTFVPAPASDPLGSAFVGYFGENCSGWCQYFVLSTIVIVSVAIIAIISYIVWKRCRPKQILRNNLVEEFEKITNVSFQSIFTFIEHLRPDFENFTLNCRGWIAGNQGRRSPVGRPWSVGHHATQATMVFTLNSGGLQISGAGSDEWGIFSIEGSTGIPGDRDFENYEMIWRKHYANSEANIVHYANFTTDNRFVGKWEDESNNSVKCTGIFSFDVSMVIPEVSSKIIRIEQPSAPPFVV